MSDADDIGGKVWVRMNERKKSVPVIRDPTTRDAKVKKHASTPVSFFCISDAFVIPFPFVAW